MVASVNSVIMPGEVARIKKSGLANHHAYTVLTALTVYGENEEAIRLVKIRDPYGIGAKSEWQTNWKDESN